ncbi:major facilitator superfamily domain-containing protein [Mycena pura]|uniref:Major facilitator superfamily domain-containing protein n=1 Tax=Mycena pura TaxID=153505 RepID=A0AAD6UYJ8_9AGAR|nr:major facilitator superfamily domain-containing protein [Mycena pura]
MADTRSDALALEIDASVSSHTGENDKKEPFETVIEYDSAADYPDGGFRAWLIVAGTIAGNAATFGYVNAWGVFQSFYEENLLKDVTPSNIAWIGSIQYSLVLMPGLITGRLFDLGYFKIPYLAASILLVVFTLLVAQCTQYWQFILCQGIATGLMCGTIFGPTLSVVGHWFHRRRGLALGLSAVGSSIGGTVFPIATHKLIPLVGFQWTMRILALLLACCLGFANLALARRLPPKNVEGGLFNLQAFKNPIYTVYCMSSFMAFLGLYTVLTYIDVSAATFGVSPDFSFYLVAIANGCSLFGRIASGFAADKFGPLNIVIPMTLASAGLTFAWPYARTQSHLIVIAVIYGVVSGAYIGVFTLPLLTMGGVADVGRRAGMAFSIAALGALAGPPISGAINTATGGFTAVGYYAGGTIILSVMLMIITRQLTLRRLWGKV